MENFKWDDKVFEFEKLTGDVISNNKFSETHISSSGGGGHVDPQYGGNVAAARVHSTVTTVHEFWVRDEKGDEHAVNLRGFDVPLAVGQKISLISTGLAGGPQTHFILLNNHNAKKYWTLQSGRALYDIFNTQSMTKFLIKIAFAILIYVLILNYTSGYITWAIHLALIYYSVKFYVRLSKMSKALDAHIEKIAQTEFYAKAI